MYKKTYSDHILNEEGEEAEQADQERILGV